MFGGKKEEKLPAGGEGGAIQTLIAEGAIFEGNLTLRTSARIEGTVKGNLRSEGELVIGDAGVIEGDVECERITVYGKVRGNVSAKRIEIKRGGEINGDITTETLVIEEGAVYNGRCSMGKEKELTESIHYEGEVGE